MKCSQRLCLVKNRMHGGMGPHSISPQHITIKAAVWHTNLCLCPLTDDKVVEPVFMAQDQPHPLF
jgi:hypothetical protein